VCSNLVMGMLDRDKAMAKSMTIQQVEMSVSMLIEDDVVEVVRVVMKIDE
jgi:hypothetical protein